MNDIAEEQTQPSNRNRNIVIGAVAAVVLLCACLVIVVGGVIAIDPFGWNVLDQLFGRSDEAAAAMPPDTGIFIGMDLLELTTENIGRIVDPFLSVSGEADIQDFDKALDQLDISLLDELGFTVQDDIMPWFGRFAGFGVSTLELGDFGDVTRLSWSLVISTHDEAASEAFLGKLRDAISSQSGYPFATSSYEDVTIYELAAPDSLEGVAMAQANGLVLLGADAGAIQASLDAKKGDSLADSDDFRALVNELPGNRALTFYADMSRYEALQEEMLQSVVPGVISGLDNAATAFSLSFTDDGLQLDTVSPVDREGMSPDEEGMLDSMSAAPSTDEFYPDVTVVYLAGARLDLVWASIRDSLSATMAPQDFDESMAMFAEEFGINPDTQLFPLLDGEWALGVLPSTAGALSDGLQIDLGAALLAQTSDQGALSTNIGVFSTFLEDQGLFVQHATEADRETYTILDGPQGTAIFNLGLTQGYLYVSTDAGTSGRLFGDAPTLADDEGYKQTWKAFPGKMTPVFYLDASGLLGAIREGLDPGMRADFDEVARFVEPISAIAVVTEPGKDTVHTETIVFITTAE
jgi:hypothetical protein